MIFFTGKFPAAQKAFPIGEARATVIDKLEPFLARHAQENDLGLRLDGEQIAAGVRFIRMVKEGTFDLVMANPPYQGTTRMSVSDYVQTKYPRARPDLYGAFMERGIELVREGGVVAMVTMRGWMFAGQWQTFREEMLRGCDLRSIADLGTGAFGERSMDDVISTNMAVFRRTPSVSVVSVALQAAPLIDKTRDAGKPARRCAALVAQMGRYEFNPKSFDAVEGAPILYWWPQSLFSSYVNAPKLGTLTPAREGLTHGNTARFVRKPWELELLICSSDQAEHVEGWVPYIEGAEGRAWFEPMCGLLDWTHLGLGLRLQERDGRILASVRNSGFYFRMGIAFTTIGDRFAARLHRVRSAFDATGRSLFPEDRALVLTSMNRSVSRFIMQSLNPGIHFTVRDVNRLPIFPVESSDQIYATLDRAFTEHESARESSVEFKHPGPSPGPTPRTGPSAPSIAPPASHSPLHSHLLPSAPRRLPLLLRRRRPRPLRRRRQRPPRQGPGLRPPGGHSLHLPSRRDSLEHPTTKLLRATWADQGRGDDEALRDWFRKDFFVDHKARYESRPIVFPLSSARKSFVALVAIHRFDDATLQTLLADWILPDRRALEGELTDLREARRVGTADQKRQAERRFADVQKLVEELDDFLLKLNQCADKGAPPSDKDTKPREADARYAMDLDDGVMVNSAGLWPLLEPQWKDPKKWWKELCNASGKKDYDWSHLAARYFPARVDEKCKKDPSLGVAHGCFWRYHPAKAYAWELRLKDEIGPDFLIEEGDAGVCRARFVKENPEQVREILAKEMARRERKKRKEEGAEQTELALEGGEEEEADA